MLSFFGRGVEIARSKLMDRQHPFRNTYLDRALPRFAGSTKIGLRIYEKCVELPKIMIGAVFGARVVPVC